MKFYFAVITPLLAGLFVAILEAEKLGLGIKEEFVLYRLLTINRTDALSYALMLSVIALLYPVAALLASRLSTLPSSVSSSGIGTERPNYRPEIDGLRAVAVLAVMANHFDEHIVASGFLGVDVFFVISGFVILSSIIGDLKQSALESLLHFYAKRVKRIVPALITFVVICGLAVSIISPYPADSLETGIIALFGASNVWLLIQSRDYFATPAQYNAFTHTWSLGVEEQFYLIVPAIVYACTFYLRGTKRLHFTLAIVLALSVASFAYFVESSKTNPAGAFYLMPARFWEIGLGCIIALFVRIRQLEGPSLVSKTALLFLFVILGVLFWPKGEVIPSRSLIVVATAALILTVKPKSVSYWLLTLTPMTFVGRISYSLYLWHWGFLSVSRWITETTIPVALILLLLIFVAATLSYYCVEAPLRRACWFAADWKTIVSAVYASTAAAILLQTFAAPLSPAFAVATTKINPLKFQPQQMVQTTLPCHLPKVVDPIRHCLASEDPSKRTIFVVGDSHASNQVPSITLAAEKLGNFEVRYLVEWGFISSLSGVPKCKDHVSRPCIDDSLAKHLEFFRRTLRPGDIVVFSWARDSTVYDGPLPRAGNQPALQILRNNLVALRSAVTSTGAILILVDDIPKPCVKEVNWQVIYATGKYELCSTSRVISREDRQPLTNVYTSLLSDGVRYFDPHDFLCVADTCGIYDGGTNSLMYAEASPHFTPARADLLVNQWVSFLSSLPHATAKADSR
jgi:peptidoglycan/LPS O-acetylase OafA/YrhL